MQRPPRSIPRTAEKVRDRIVDATDIAYLIEIEVSEKLAEAKNTERRILLPQERGQASMIREEFKMNSIEQGTPR